MLTIVTREIVFKWTSSFSLLNLILPSFLIGSELAYGTFGSWFEIKLRWRILRLRRFVVFGRYPLCVTYNVVFLSQIQMKPTPWQNGVPWKFWVKLTTVRPLTVEYLGRITKMIVFLIRTFWCVWLRKEGINDNWDLRLV